jgi:hypothetical protein
LKLPPLFLDVVATATVTIHVFPFEGLKELKRRPFGLIYR